MPIRVPIRIDTGRGTGDRALELRRVLPSAWKPGVQRSVRSKICLGTPNPGTPGGIITPSLPTSLGPASGFRKQPNTRRPKPTKGKKEQKRYTTNNNKKKTRVITTRKKKRLSFNNRNRLRLNLAGPLAIQRRPIRSCLQVVRRRPVSAELQVVRRRPVRRRSGVINDDPIAERTSRWATGTNQRDRLSTS